MRNDMVAVVDRRRLPSPLPWNTLQPMVICKLIYCIGISISFFVYRMCYSNLFSCCMRYALPRFTYHSIDSPALSLLPSHRSIYYIFITSSLFFVKWVTHCRTLSAMRAYIYSSYSYIYLFSTSLKRNILHRSLLWSRGLCWMCCVVFVAVRNVTCFLI